MRVLRDGLENNVKKDIKTRSCLVVRIALVDRPFDTDTKSGV